MSDAARLDVLPQIDANVVSRTIVERVERPSPSPIFSFWKLTGRTSRLAIPPNEVVSIEDDSRRFSAHCAQTP
jgi:hypothetical protein